MGTYRLLLAAMVMSSHIGFLPVAGFNQGPVAVISFYLISGYVMTMLMQKHFSTVGRVPFFYIDRAARLLPQLYFYMLMALLLVSIAAVPVEYLSKCNAKTVALNFLVVPLDFFNHWKPLRDVGNCQLDPPAWSIGLEITFYLFAPAIVLLPKLTRVAAVISIAIFLYAWLGFVHVFVFGYSLLPGTLFMFLVGASFAKPDLIHRKLPLIVWLGAAIISAAVWNFPALAAEPLNYEIPIGLIIGIPALAVLSRLATPDSASRWSALYRLDGLLGNYSYGVFLNHYLLIWLALLAGINLGDHLVAFALASLALSAFSFHVIEAPALKLRRAFRYKTETTKYSTFTKRRADWPNLRGGEPVGQRHVTAGHQDIPQT